ncbi:MAG: acyltransferase, partial [Pseudomonadota bacterium]|nr:acyltransferase [Pseudomonadota bacterium]
LGAVWLQQGTPAGQILLHLALPYAVLWFAQLDLQALAPVTQRGDFSYGVYLYAFPVQQTFSSFGASAWPLPVYVGCAFVVTLACAVLSWRLVEAPALRLKRMAASACALPNGIGQASGLP